MQEQIMCLTELHRGLIFYARKNEIGPLPGNLTSPRHLGSADGRHSNFTVCL